MFEKESLEMHAGRMYGPHRAVVTDNKDPKKQGRIKLSCPSVYGNDSDNKPIESRWAMSMLEHGTYNIPKIGDYVWLFLEMGHKDYPLWLGTICSDSKPQNKKFTNRLSPNIYGFVTPNGHTIEFDDDKNSDEIRITHSKGTKMTITKDGVIVNSTITCEKLVAKVADIGIVNSDSINNGGNKMSKTSATFNVINSATINNSGSISSKSASIENATITSLSPSSCSLK